MTNPVVDVSAAPGAADDKTGVIVPVYPQSGKAEVFTWQLRTLVARRAARSARRAGSPIRSTKTFLDRHDLVDRTTSRCAAIHRPESMAELEAAQAAADVRRVPAHAGRARRAQARARGRAVGHRARRRRRPLVARSSTACRSRSPATRQRAIDEITARHGEPRRRCTGCCRATSARARPSSRSPRCSSRCRAGTRARSWRRPRCSPSSTTSRRVTLLEGLTVPRDGSLLGDRPVRVELLTNRTTAAERRRIGAALADRRGRHPRRHARAALRRRRVHASSGSR